MAYDFLSPLLVSSSINPVAVNTRLQIDPTQLLNPNRSAMLVDQFRFTTLLNSSGSATTVIPQQMYVSIKLGTISLTNGFVPIVTLCPTYDGGFSSTATLPSRATVIPASNPLVWHLPKPLYVPPNVVMYVDVQRKLATYDSGTESQTADAYFRVAVAGRSMPHTYPIPLNINVPWATATTITSDFNVTSIGNVSTFVSPDNALGNPNNSDLTVTRFTGYRASASGAVSVGGFGQTITDWERQLLVRMTVSNGKLLVRDPTPFFHLFPASRRFFDMHGILRGGNAVPGGEFVKVKVDLDPPPHSGSTTFDRMFITMIGMIGYRTVPTPMGAAQG